MDWMTSWASLRDRLSRTWQIPLLVVSVALLVGAFLRVRPVPANLPFEESLTYLETLVDGRAYDRALEVGGQLLTREDCAGSRVAIVHHLLARAVFVQAELEKRQSAELGHQISQHYGLSTQAGRILSADDHVRWASAEEWQERWLLAAEHIEAAIALQSPSSVDLQRRAVELRQRLGIPAEELDQRLDGLMQAAGDERPDVLAWALEQKLEVLEQLGRTSEASTWLMRYAEKLTDTAFAEAFHYLEALYLFRTQHYDEAEAFLRSLRNRIPSNDEINAKSGWLLGRIVLGPDGPGRPAEALSFFTDVVSRHAESPYAVASRVGMAEALAQLQRHVEAVETYHRAIEELASVSASALVNRDVLRTSLTLEAQTQLQSAQLSAARDYAELALQLANPENVEQLALHLQQLGGIQRLLSEEADQQADALGHVMPDSGGHAKSDAPGLFAAAAETFERISNLPSSDDERAAEACLQAAELFAKSGQLRRSADIYQTFVTKWPEHSLIARALFRKGQLYRAMGDWVRAVETFQENFRRFPKSLDGAKSLIPLAQCYLAMGSDRLEQAEQTLMIILHDSEWFTPAAPEFADALFLLGDVLIRREALEEAIGRLEEALTRYPNDPRALRARSRLADAYRHSALALKQKVGQATSAPEIEQLRKEILHRFHAARGLYRAVIDELAAQNPARLTPMEAYLLRFAHANEADCYFEAGEFREAAQRYAEITALFDHTLTALSAYVQMINCHVFLGEPEQARAALARARMVVDAMPPETFVESLSSETRDDWKRYFEWIEQSDLL